MFSYPDAENGIGDAVAETKQHAGRCYREPARGFSDDRIGHGHGDHADREYPSLRTTPQITDEPPRLWLDNIWRAGFPPAPQPLGSGRRNDRRRCWRMTLGRNRKFADSPLEETVRSELVSDMSGTAKLTRIPACLWMITEA